VITHAHGDHLRPERGGSIDKNRSEFRVHGSRFVFSSGFAFEVRFLVRFRVLGSVPGSWFGSGFLVWFRVLGSVPGFLVQFPGRSTSVVRGRLSVNRSLNGEPGNREPRTTNPNPEPNPEPNHEPNPEPNHENEP
jgi:hypothetical protein